MRRRRGQILLMVLLVFLLMMALVTGVASTAYLVQRSSDEYTRQSTVRNLGDSALATAIAKIRDDSSFGSPVEYQDERGKAVVTFDAGHSTNNILGDGSKPGVNGSVVPPGTAQLVAEVTYRGRSFSNTVMIGKSPFPYVVASSGAFTSNGSLLLGALRSLTDLQDGLAPDDLVKGSLLTNSSLTISGPADVIGDLKTASTASLTGVNQRQGKLTENAKPEDIPQIRLTDYDPAGKPEIIEYKTAPPSRSAKLELSGLARASLPVVLDEGLNLNGGVLYVDGDLTVSKGVTGYGAVFATGKIKVSGGSNLGSDSLCALVAGGDLEIKGAGADKTQFRGLVYSYGALSVSDVTIVGSLVGASTSGRGMTVERANLVYDPEGVAIDLDLQWSGFDGKVDPRGYSVMAPGSNLTPKSLWTGSEYREPTMQELRESFYFSINGSVLQEWDKFSRADQTKLDQMVTGPDGPLETIIAQTSQWEKDGLSPDRSDASFHLNLNRFINVNSSFKILGREH